MLRRAHCADSRGGIAKRVMSDFRYRQLTVCDEPIHRGQHVADPLRVARCHQCQIHIVEREVAPEWEQPQPGVGIDVVFAKLHEASADSQQFQPGTLCGAGQELSTMSTP